MKIIHDIVFGVGIGVCVISGLISSVGILLLSLEWIMNKVMNHFKIFRFICEYFNNREEFLKWKDETTV